MVIAWIPSQVGISGKEKADRLAKAALTSSLVAHSHVCWSDLKPRVDTLHLHSLAGTLEQRNQKQTLRNTSKPKSLCNTTQSLYRKHETVMTRLRIGHIWITHSYLLKKEDQPFCHACDNPFILETSTIQQLTFTHFSERLIP